MSLKKLMKSCIVARLLPWYTAVFIELIVCFHRCSFTLFHILNTTNEPLKNCRRFFLRENSAQQRKNSILWTKNKPSSHFFSVHSTKKSGIFFDITIYRRTHKLYGRKSTIHKYICCCCRCCENRGSERALHFQWIGFLKSVNDIYKANYIAQHFRRQLLHQPATNIRDIFFLRSLWERWRYAFRKRFNNNHVITGGATVGKRPQHHLLERAKHGECYRNVSPQRNKFEQFFPGYCLGMYVYHGHTSSVCAPRHRLLEWNWILSVDTS